MNRRAHRIDAQLRRLPLPSDEQAAAMSSPAAKQALFERITAMPTTTPAATRPRIPRRTLVLATILATLSIGAVGGACWATARMRTTG